MLGVLSLPGGGQRGAARGVVTMRRFQIVGQLRVGGEGFGKQANCCCLEALVLVAQEGEFEALGGIRWFGIAMGYFRSAYVLFEPLTW